jgi:hypothetical protein
LERNRSDISANAANVKYTSIIDTTNWAITFLGFDIIMGKRA